MMVNIVALFMVVQTSVLHMESLLSLPVGKSGLEIQLFEYGIELARIEFKLFPPFPIDFIIKIFDKFYF
jgi:hypothetical protein